MADISATARLDATEFSAGLQEALRAARAWKTQVERDANVDPLRDAVKSARDFAREISKVKVPNVTREAQQVASSVQQVATETRAAATANRELDTSFDDIRARAKAAQQAYLSGATSLEEYRQQQAGFKTEIAAVVAAQDDQTRATDAFMASVKENDAAVQELGVAVRNVRSAYIAGRIGADEYRDSSEALKRQIDALYQSTELNAAQQLKLNIASATAERGLAMLRGEASRLGLAQGVAIGTTNAWADSFRNLSGAIGTVLAAGGLAKLLQILTRFSAESDAARTSVALFQQSVAARNGSIDLAARSIERWSDALEVTQGVVASFGEPLIRAGLSIEQTGKAAEAGAALALNANKKVAEGFDIVSRAILSGRSDALIQLGITVDLAKAETEYAATLDRTRGQLEDHELVLARTAAITEAGAFAIERYADRQRDFGGSTNRLNTAMEKFRQNIGDSSQVLIGPMNDALARVVDLFNALPKPLQASVVATTVLATGAAGLAIAYATLTTVLGKLNIRQTLGNALIGSEALQRTVLGQQLTVLAGRYRLLTQEQVANTAASAANAGSVSLLGTAGLAARTGLQAAASGLWSLTRAGVAFVLTPVGAVLTAIAVSVALITTAVRRFDALFKPVFDAFRTAVAVTAEAFEPLQRAMSTIGRIVGPALADFLRGTLARVAYVAGAAILFLAETMEKVAVVARFFSDIASVGLRQAWTNLVADVENTRQAYEELREELYAAAQAAADGSLATNRLEKDVDALGGAAAKTEEELRDLWLAAVDLKKGFEERFIDQELGFLPDGLDKDIEAVRIQFRRLREEILQKAGENEFFAANAQGLLTQAFENEQRAILQIQERYAAERQAQAARQARELEDTIRERERAIVDARTSGLLSDVQARTLEYQRRRQDTETLYRDLLERTRAYGGTTTQLEQARVDELLAIQQQYQRDVARLYATLNEEIEDRQRDLLRQVLTARGDQRGLASLDYDDALRSIDEFHRARRQSFADNATALANLEALEAEERAAAWEAYWSNITRITAEGSQTILELEEGLARRRAEIAGDAGTVASIDSAAAIRNIEAQYQDLVRVFAGNDAELVRLARLRNDAIELENQVLADNLRDLADTARAEAFEPAITALLDGLDDASRGAVEGIRAQLQAWRQAYGSNGEIATLVDAALAQVGTRYDRLQRESATAIEKMVTDAGRLYAALQAEDAERGMSSVDRVLTRAADRVSDIRAQQEALTAALADAVGQDRTRILEAASQLEQGLRIIEANATADAREVIENAIRAYEDGLRQARENAGKAAFDAVSGDLRSFMDGLTRVNAAALTSAREQLYGLYNDLTARGVDRSQLAGVQAYIDDVDGLLRNHAQNLAGFAGEQLDLVRRVGQAILSERDARELNLATLQFEIELRERALEAANRAAAAGLGTAEDAVAAERAVLTAQLALLRDREDLIVVLEQQQRAIFDALNTAPPQVAAAYETALQGSRAELVANIEAAQAAGAAYEAYADDLQRAIEVNDELQAISAARAAQLDQEVEAAAAVRAVEARLVAARRLVAEQTLLAADGERDRTRAMRAVITTTNEALNQHRAEADALRDVAQQYADAGNLQRARAARDQLVQTGARMIDTLRAELDATRALSEQYRERVAAITEIRREVNRLSLGIRGLDVPELTVGSVRQETERLKQLQQQNATLEEQRDQFQRIEQAAAKLREQGGQLTFGDLTRLQEVEAAFAKQATTEARVAREREALAAQQAKTLEERLGATLETLTNDVANLAGALGTVLEEPDDALANVFARIGEDAALVPERIAAITRELALAREEADRIAESIGAALGIDAYTSDAGAALAAFVATLGNRSDLAGVGATAGRAFADSMAEEIEALGKELDAALGPAADALTSGAITAGETAGIGLTDAFGEGIRRGEAGLLSIIDNVLQKVRDRLPSSDAKTGPLSTLKASGRTLFPTWMTGVREGHARVTSTFDRLLRNLRPNAGFTLAGASMTSGGAGAAPVTLHVDGRPQSMTPGPLALNARELARTAIREADIQLRMRGRR